MRLLVIGGTRFVGRYVVEAALARGHDVTLLHRGRTGVDLFDEAEHLLADRDDPAALTSVLAGREFDATVDVCGYVPRQVRMLAEALGGRGGHHVYVSSVSAYADPDGPGADESSPLAVLEDETTEDVMAAYGGLKAVCERVAGELYGAEGLTVIRPTYVIGPFDPTGRFTRWVDRIRHGGDVLAPGPAEAPVQVVDGRDQAELMVDLAEKGRAGAFNTIGTAAPYTFADLLGEIVAAVGPADTRLVWADAGWLKDQGVDGHQLPLWSEGTIEHAMAMSNAAALDAGMPVRPVADTVRDTLAWIDEVDAGGGTVYRHPPLSAEREAELLTSWAVRGRGRG
jgi:2'-hydroxyisoflavone reductase